MKVHGPESFDREVERSLSRRKPDRRSGSVAQNYCRSLKGIMVLSLIALVGCCALPKLGPDCNVCPPYESRVSTTEGGYWRVIAANGIPDHRIGAFPNPHNPNSLRAQDYHFAVPANPGPTRDEFTPLEPLTPFGVAVNGVVLDPAAAEWWNNDPMSGWEENPLSTAAPDLGLDCNNAHVQPSGAYHYHGLPTGLYEKLGGSYPWKSSGPAAPAVAKMVLLGWGFDGTPVYGPTCLQTNTVGPNWWTPTPGWKIISGMRPPPPAGPGGPYNGRYVQDYEFVLSSGALDMANGHVWLTPDHPDPIYHYHITEDFPYIPRYHRKRETLLGPTPILLQ